MCKPDPNGLGQGMQVPRVMDVVHALIMLYARYIEF